MDLPLVHALTAISPNWRIKPTLASNIVLLEVVEAAAETGEAVEAAADMLKAPPDLLKVGFTL
jgi:hypothetical protein